MVEVFFKQNISKEYTNCHILLRHILLDRYMYIHSPSQHIFHNVCMGYSHIHLSPLHGHINFTYQIYIENEQRSDQKIEMNTILCYHVYSQTQCVTI